MREFSPEAFLQLRQSLLFFLNERVTVGDISVHHSVLFHNEHRYWYFFNRLVKEGLVIVADFLSSPSKVGHFPPSKYSSNGKHAHSLSAAHAKRSPMTRASVVLQCSPKFVFQLSWWHKRQLDDNQWRYGAHAIHLCCHIRVKNLSERVCWLNSRWGTGSGTGCRRNEAVRVLGIEKWLYTHWTSAKFSCWHVALFESAWKRLCTPLDMIIYTL